MNKGKEKYQGRGFSRFWLKLFRFQQSFFISSRPGIALLLTLLVTGVLASSTLAFLRMANLEAKVTDNTYVLTQAELMAQAGLKGAMGILAADDFELDTFNDPWAKYGSYAAVSSALFEEGGFSGEIIDLSGRISLNDMLLENGLINPAKKAQLERLLILLDLEPGLAAPIMDWLDADDELQHGPWGAERGYYQVLNPSYEPANGPLDSLGQLLLIKDMTSAILYGSKERVGLAEFIAASSGGKINVNTAGQLVLMSLDEDLTFNLAEEIILRRETEPFISLADFRDRMGLSPDLFNRIVGLTQVKSTHFLVRVEGRFRQAVIKLTAVLERSEDNVILVYYKTG